MDFPNKKYTIIYADPPWAYKRKGSKDKHNGCANQHYPTMSVEDICNLPVKDICNEQAICFMWATFLQLGEALQVMRAWGFEYKTCAFVWVKKNAKSNTNFWGMGAYTRANAEICLLGITPNFRVNDMIKSHAVHSIIEAPIEDHSKKPDETRDRIVDLLGDVPRIELFARRTSPGWDAWGNEI